MNEEDEKESQKILEIVSALPDALRVKIVSKILHDFLGESSSGSIMIVHKEPEVRCPVTLIATHGTYGSLILTSLYNQFLEMISDKNLIARSHRTMLKIIDSPDFTTKLREAIKRSMVELSRAKGQVLENPDTHDNDNILFFAHQEEETDPIAALLNNFLRGRTNETRPIQRKDDDPQQTEERKDGASGARDGSALAREQQRLREINERRASDRPQHYPISPASPIVPDGVEAEKEDQSPRSEEGEGYKGKINGVENNDPSF